MVFSSPVFLFCYLPIALIGFFLVPVRARTPLLFAMSLLFYAWGEGHYVWLLLLSIALNWLLALALERIEAPRSRRMFLAGAVALNIGALVYFKYANFLVANFAPLAVYVGLQAPTVAAIHLPIGISFVTFEALAYVVDVYRRHTGARKNPIHVGFYMSFFPHLIAGPIMRFDDVADRLAAPRTTAPYFESGVRRFTVGLAKKVLLANTMGRVADDAFHLVADSLGCTTAWLGIVAYALQIYFDFSGYTDMAIGLGRMCGFELPRNFDLPYSAASIRDFWRRWHISLSRWFRDYLYIPLGGNRGSALKTYRNLVLVFFCCGLWHGASWTFVIWGLYHGVFLVLERLRFGRWLSALWSPLQHAYALLVVLIGWVFFRAESFSQALAFLGAMSGFGTGSALSSVAEHLDREELLALIIGLPIATLPVVRWLEQAAGRISALPGATLVLNLTRTAVLLGALLVCGAYLAAGTYNPFIYFRF